MFSDDENQKVFKSYHVFLVIICLTNSDEKNIYDHESMYDFDSDNQSSIRY